MKLYFTHPFKENVSINFGNFTQIIGQDQQLKYYIWQLLVWYFDGKKYNEEDLTLFDQTEPIIATEEAQLKRSEFKVISISGIDDLINQMDYKKGTVAFEYLKAELDNIEVMEQIDLINNKLDMISEIVNNQLNFVVDNIHYHTESQYFTSEQLIQKNFLPFFGLKNKNISYEFVENKTKFMIFLKMLDVIVTRSTQKYLLTLRNMDDYLSYRDFMDCCEQLEYLTQKIPFLFSIVFPSNEGYLFINQENIENVNIVSDFIEHFYDFNFMYERFTNEYPINDVLSEKQFLSSIRKISPYLFSQEIEHMSLSVEDMVTLKILNSLYQYKENQMFKVSNINPMLIQFLSDHR